MERRRRLDWTPAFAACLLVAVVALVGTAVSMRAYLKEERARGEYTRAFNESSRVAFESEMAQRRAAFAQQLQKYEEEQKLLLNMFRWFERAKDQDKIQLVSEKYWDELEEILGEGGDRR